MSIITTIEDEAKKILIEIEGGAKTIETKAVALTEAEIVALSNYIETQVGADIMAEAKTIIAEFIDGTSFSAAEAQLIAYAASVGKTLLQGAAQVALNTAKALFGAQAATSTPAPTPEPTAVS